MAPKANLGIRQRRIVVQRAGGSVESVTEGWHDYLLCLENHVLETRLLVGLIRLLGAVA